MVADVSDMDDRAVGLVRDHTPCGPEVRRWNRGRSAYDGIDQPRVLRRALRAA